MVNALFGGFRQNRCRPSNGDKKARQIMPGFLRLNVENRAGITLPEAVQETFGRFNEFLLCQRV